MSLLCNARSSLEYCSCIDTTYVVIWHIGGSFKSGKVCVRSLQPFNVVHGFFDRLYDDVCMTAYICLLLIMVPPYWPPLHRGTFFICSCTCTSSLLFCNSALCPFNARYRRIQLFALLLLYSVLYNFLSNNSTVCPVRA